MVETTNLCLAILKNGSPCSYKGRIEYKGYCGVHKFEPIKKDGLSDIRKDKRLVNLLSAGTSLVILLEKAVGYLPQFVEILVKASGIAFVREVGEVIEYIEDINETKYVKFMVSPTQLPIDINDLIKTKSWQLLLNNLGDEFNSKITSGDIPEELIKKIKEQQNFVKSKLFDLGFTPSKINFDN